MGCKMVSAGMGISGDRGWCAWGNRGPQETPSDAIPGEILNIYWIQGMRMRILDSPPPPKDPPGLLLLGQPAADLADDIV